MRVVHAVDYVKNKVRDRIVISLDESDLLPEEAHESLVKYRATLLQIRAEKQAIIVKQGLGLFHKKPEENQRLAAERGEKIDAIYKSILGLRK